MRQQSGTPVKHAAAEKMPNFPATSPKGNPYPRTCRTVSNISKNTVQHEHSQIRQWDVISLHRTLHGDSLKFEQSYDSYLQKQPFNGRAGTKIEYLLYIYK